jgi:hypothetical protein
LERPQAFGGALVRDAASRAALGLAAASPDDEGMASALALALFCGRTGAAKGKTREWRWREKVTVGEN